MVYTSISKDYDHIKLFNDLHITLVIKYKGRYTQYIQLLLCSFSIPQYILHTYTLYNSSFSYSIKGIYNFLGCGFLRGKTNNVLHW